MPRGVVGGQRIVEEHGEAVLHERANGAFEPESDGAQALVIGAKDGDGFLRCVRLGQLAEPWEVTGDDRDLAPMALEQGLAFRGDQQLRDLRRQEASQTIQALELGDLLADAGFQGPVPRGKLERLLFDRVVIGLDAQQRRHPGQQLRLIERLLNKVVGARFQCAQPLLVAASGNHDHREIPRRWLGPQPATHLQPVELRHHDVQEHQVRLIAAHSGEGFRAGSSRRPPCTRAA